MPGHAAAGATHHVHVVTTHHHVTRVARVRHAGFGKTGKGERGDRRRDNGESDDFHEGTWKARTELPDAAQTKLMRHDWFRLEIRHRANGRRRTLQPAVGVTLTA